MRILWNEQKKIITWKILLLLFIVNSILFYILIEFESLIFRTEGRHLIHTISGLK